MNWQKVEESETGTKRLSHRLIRCRQKRRHEKADREIKESNDEAGGSSARKQTTDWGGRLGHSTNYNSINGYD